MCHRQEFFFAKDCTCSCLSHFKSLQDLNPGPFSHEPSLLTIRPPTRSYVSFGIGHWHVGMLKKSQQLVLQPAQLSLQLDIWCVEEAAII